MLNDKIILYPLKVGALESIDLLRGPFEAEEYCADVALVH